jgi:hypothetical protein
LSGRVLRSEVKVGLTRTRYVSVSFLPPSKAERTFRARFLQILHLLISLFESLPSPDYFSITQCFVYLNDPSLASSLLTALLHLGPSSASDAVPADEAILTAYQIAFDLAETATQEFLQVVSTSLAAPAPAAAVEGEAAAPVEGEKVGKELHRERVISILSGEESIKLYLEFLYRNNKSDMLILKGTMVCLLPFPPSLLPFLTLPLIRRTPSNPATRSTTPPSPS